MEKKVLVVLSEYGYWGIELVGPVEKLTKAGYEMVYATPTGKRPQALPPSMDPTYVDPPLGTPVTSEEDARKVREMDQSPVLDNPVNISEIVPEIPYMSEPDYLRKLENYYDNLKKVDEFVSQFTAILMVGGSGPILDMANNQRVHDLVLSFLRQDKLIAAECYAVTTLAFARNIRNRRSIIKGKHVTGHPKEYDYHNNYGYLNVEGNFAGPPYPLEYILRDAVGCNGDFDGKVGESVSVMLDYPFLTSRSIESSYAIGEVMVKCLEEGIRKYGW